MANDNKDRSLAATMFITPIEAALQAPQLLATKFMSGKIQTPSKALNTKTSGEALLADTILDPLNLFGGVGIGSKSAKTRNFSK